MPETVIVMVVFPFRSLYMSVTGTGAQKPCLCYICVIVLLLMHVPTRSKYGVPFNPRLWKTPSNPGDILMEKLLNDIVLLFISTTIVDIYLLQLFLVQAPVFCVTEYLLVSKAKCCSYSSM